MLRKINAHLAVLFAAIMLTVGAGALMPVQAQYTPPGTPSALATSPFQPTAKTSALAASGTSASLTLAGNSATYLGMTTIQVYNAATTAAFVIFCATSTCTASAGSAGTSTSDYPIAPGAVITMTIPQGMGGAAVVLASGSGTVYFTPGIGL